MYTHNLLLLNPIMWDTSCQQRMLIYSESLWTTYVHVPGQIVSLLNLSIYMKSKSQFPLWTCATSVKCNEDESVKKFCTLCHMRDKYATCILCSFLYSIHVHVYLEIDLESAEKLEGSQVHVLHYHQMLFFPICFGRLSRSPGQTWSASYCDPLEIDLSEVVHNLVTNRKIVICKIF